MDVTNVDSRKRGNKRKTLTVADKVSIIHQVVISKIYHKQVAKEFRVTPACVSMLVRKAQRNPKFLSEMVSDQ